MKTLLRWLKPVPLRLPEPASEVAPAPVPSASGLRSDDVSAALRLDAVQRGQEAERLLQHPVLLQAFADLRQEAINEWLGSTRDQHDRREELYRTIQALGLLRGKLGAYRAFARIKAEEAA